LSIVASTTIRPLEATDWDAWWALRLRALADHPDAFGSDLDETLAAGEQAARNRFAPLHKHDRNQVFGAFTGEGNLVGVAGLLGTDRRKQRHRAFIWGVYVAPEARGAGVGKTLIEACVAHAREVPGTRQVHLTVASHNVSTVALYERCGFSRYGREPRALILPDGREVDEDLMVLMLDR
jgi:ribosomal protein S18 acetylase RimI-like enzyme